MFVFLFLCIADGRRDKSEMTLRQSRSLSWKIQRESISKIEYYNFYPFIVLLIFFLMCICRWLLPSDRARHAAMRPSATLLSNRFRSVFRCNNRYYMLLSVYGYWNRFSFFSSVIHFVYAYAILLCMEIGEMCVLSNWTVFRHIHLFSFVVSFISVDEEIVEATDSTRIEYTFIKTGVYTGYD